MKIALFTTLLAIATAGFAQSTGSRPECPYMTFEGPGNTAKQYLPLVDLTANVHIAASIADVSLVQTFTNAFSAPIEAVYVFPGSTNAAIYGLSMQIGDRTVYARIEEKYKARAQYETAKEDGYRASLLEQKRPNVFQMKVANIMPGDTIRVTLNYTEYIDNDAGTYRFVLPTTIGPRYSGENRYHTAPPIEATYLPGEVSSSHPLAISLRLSAGVPIQHVTSSSHRIDVNMIHDKYYRVSLNPTERYKANKDFIFEYKLRGDELASGILQHTDDTEQFFMLQVQPPKQVRLDMVPPREYLFVIDVSGSMNGFPLETAKVLLENLLFDLRPQDRFNIIQFEFGSKQLFRESVTATQQNIDRAVAFVRTRNSLGGTNLASALQGVYDQVRNAEISRSTVIITDGHIEAEKKVFKLIRDNLFRSNVFAFGIGSSVNRYLIEGVAQAGMGRSFIVTDPAFAPAKANELATYINRPALTDISIDFSTNKVYEVSPLSFPDVLSDRPLTIYGKYFGVLTDDIVVHGRTGSERYAQRIVARQDSLHNPALKYLWARSKIKELIDFNDATSRIIEEVKNLGLTYSLLTDYTSFVAVDSELANNDQRPVSIRQPIPVPADYSNAPNYRMRLQATGAVSRAAGSSPITIALPAQSNISAPLLLIKWDNRVPGPYRVIVEDIHSDVIFEQTTDENYLWLQTEQLYDMGKKFFLLRVASGDQRSAEHGLKYEKSDGSYDLMFDFNYGYPVADYIKVIDALMNSNYEVDAFTLVEIALIHYPTDKTLLEKWNMLWMR